MDIPNLSEMPTQVITQKTLKLSFLILAMVLGLTTSLLFLFIESKSIKAGTVNLSNNSGVKVVSTSEIKKGDEVKAGVTYGSASKQFTDKATGTVQKGGINGEGTHTLEREGGLTQRAALTSSILDLDLFIGKKVEIIGQTNTSLKSGWLLDVGMIKVLE